MSTSDEGYYSQVKEQSMFQTNAVSLSLPLRHSPPAAEGGKGKDRERPMSAAINQP